MKTKHLPYVLFFILALGISFSVATMEKRTDTSKTNTSEMTPKDSVLRHVVLFKFTEETSASKLTEIETAFSQLPSKIKEIQDYEWGLNNSPEGLEKGFTHCFFVTFKTEEARSVYLPHPDHKAFVELASPHIEDVLVVDYWTN